MAEKNPKSLYLIDGTAVAYRSYFAFIKNPLVNSRGLNTGAVYGFAMTLAKILKESRPDYCAVVFDSKEPTHRHKKYPEYKATREKMPDEMADQIPYIEKLVKSLSLPYIALPTFEADDILATIATKFAGSDVRVFLVSGDKDLMQIVDDNIKLAVPKKAGETEIVDSHGVEKKFGVPPGKIVDLLSLMGDSSDNVPGVPGVGEKTALKLIQRFGTLEEVLKNSGEFESKKIAKAIGDNKDLAVLSRELVTLDKDVPLDIKLDDLKTSPPDGKSLALLFDELEFHNMTDKFGAAQGDAEHSGEYILVNDQDTYNKLAGILKNTDSFVFDTETTSLNPAQARLVGVSFSFEEGRAFYLPFNLKDPPIKELTRDNLKGFIKGIFENPEIKKGGHNVKYDSLVLKNEGIEVEGIDFDTMIESYLLAPSARQHNLDTLSLKHLNYRKIALETLIGKGSSQISMEDVDAQTVSGYSCEDADMTMRLHNLFSPEIKKLNLLKLYREVEMPLLTVLREMEFAGVTVDPKILSSISDEVERQMTSLKTDIYETAGESFNINSPKKLGEMLFEKLKIHERLGIKRVKKTKTGYATGSEILEAYSSHEIVNKILSYRNLSKLKSTYLDALPELIDKNTGRIHTSFNQTVTATGRLSSSDPNLQNIPIRTELGRKIRRAFVPQKSDWSIVSADYSQIELRILAHLSGDKNLIETFKEGVDVHLRTASTVFGIPQDKVDAELRSRAKAVNFGIIYGMGPARLAKETKIPFEEAQSFIDSYFEKYPGIKEFIDTQVKAASQNGFVTTLLGRRRYIEDIDSPNPRLKINAEHIAVNTPIQGSAADMIKIAMINIYRSLKSESMGSKMIIQVHDELVFEAPDSELGKLIGIVTQEMENALPLCVPVKVDIKSGKSWFEAH